MAACCLRQSATTAAVAAATAAHRDPFALVWALSLASSTGTSKTHTRIRRLPRSHVAGQFYTPAIGINIALLLPWACGRRCCCCPLCPTTMPEQAKESSRGEPSPCGSLDKFHTSYSNIFTIADRHVAVVVALAGPMIELTSFARPTRAICGSIWAFRRCPVAFVFSLGFILLPLRQTCQLCLRKYISSGWTCV